MEKIYIGFSTNPKNLVSGAIRLLEGSEYSHVYIRKVSKYGEYVYQASGLAVNFMNVEIFKQHNKVIEEYEFELEDDKKEKMLSFFIKYAGCSYETMSLLKLSTMILGRRLGWDIKFADNGRDKFICSELGALFCEEILEIEVAKDLDFITPRGLNPIIKAHGKRVI